MDPVSPTSRRVFLRLSASAIALTGAGQAAGVETAVAKTTGSYQSQGRAISVERFEPRAAGKYPAVLVVHGSGGMKVGGARFREVAGRLAERGYVAHVVHYFDLTGTFLADKPTMEKNFAGWMKTLADGLTNLVRQPNVDEKRIGLVGFSLGGFLSVSLSVFDHRVAAVAEAFGGLPDVIARDVQGLPPLLILHGDADRVVPVSEARKLGTLWREKRAPHELRIYPGQGHGFYGAEGEDAFLRTVAFLDAHVKSADPSRATRLTAPVPTPEAITRAEQAAAGSAGR